MRFKNNIYTFTRTTKERGGGRKKDKKSVILKFTSAPSKTKTRLKLLPPGSNPLPSTTPLTKPTPFERDRSSTFETTLTPPPSINYYSQQRSRHLVLITDPTVRVGCLSIPGQTWRTVSPTCAYFA